MKTMIFLAAALSFGGVAQAQDTTPPAADPSMTAPATPDAAAPAAGDASAPDTSVTQPGAAPSMAAPDSSDMSQAGTAPATDPGMTASAQGNGNLPVCSKSVTDNCREGTARKSTRHRRR